jgi:acyl dehydratase
LNKVRFPAPVPVGARIRASATLSEAKPVDGGVQAELTTTVELDSQLVWRSTWCGSTADGQIQPFRQA